MSPLYSECCKIKFFQSLENGKLKIRTSSKGKFGSLEHLGDESCNFGSLDLSKGKLGSSELSWEKFGSL